MGTTGTASDGEEATGISPYCLSADIAKFLWINDGADFSASTKPTKVAVDVAIDRAESIINEATKHAWHKVSITNEYHDYLIPSYAHRRPFGWVRGRQPDRGVYLTHRAIRTFVSGTDKIEIYDGDEWKDLILTANGFEEGRDKDYWISCEEGIIFFINETPAIGKKTVRVTYSFGEATVSEDIKEAAIKLTAINLLYSDDRSAMVIDGMDNIGLDLKVRAWKEDVDKILKERKDLIFA